MTIETKYNIGDKVWICKDYKKGIIQGQVQDLRATSVFLCRTPTIEYTIRWVNNRGNLTLFHRLEEDIFPTKEELLKSL
jgi:hypothetical protein